MFCKVGESDFDLDNEGNEDSGSSNQPSGKQRTNSVDYHHSMMSRVDLG